MKGASKAFVVVVGLAVLGMLAVAILTVRVEPGFYGVKQNQLGGGVVERDYTTGFKLRIPGVHRFHMLDRRTHFVTFAESDRPTSRGQTRPALEIRTKDNNLATYDLTVTYRIAEGGAHKLVAEGKKDIYRDRVVTTIESVMREELAELSSEQIYSTKERLAVAEVALPRLANQLDEFHVVPEAILIRAIRFPPGYEERLQEKQLTYQKRELAEAQKLVEDQRAITDTKAAEIEAAEKELRGDWNKRLQTVQSDNDVVIAGILAEADVYDRGTRARSDATYERLVAEGRLELDKAEALRDELRNRALDSVGGRIYLAQRAATNLQFDGVTLNSNDPNVPSVIDIEGMVRLLVGNGDGD